MLIRETREMKAKENDVKVALDALKKEDIVAENENDQAKHDKESLKKGSRNAFFSVINLSRKVVVVVGGRNMSGNGSNTGPNVYKILIW